jgi:hypothetical protein
VNNNLSLYSANLPGDSRRAGRAISRYQTDGQVRIARMETDADVADAKGDIYTVATGMAMGHVVRVAQGQRAMEQLASQLDAERRMNAATHVTLQAMRQAMRQAVRRAE